MIDPQLQEKVVLVTGANNLQGIGAAVARAFARQGAKILLSYLRLSPQEFGIDQSEAAQATEAGSPYYHARRAESAVQVVDAIKAGTRPSSDDERDAIAWQLAHELHTTHRVSDATYADAVRLFEEIGVAELVNLAGYYTMVSMTLNTFDVPLPAGAEYPFPR